jgi:hypothetical protein
VLLVTQVSKQQILATARRLADATVREETSAEEVARELGLDADADHELLYYAFWNAKERGELKAHWPGSMQLPVVITFF